MGLSVSMNARLNAFGQDPVTGHIPEESEYSSAAPGTPPHPSQREIDAFVAEARRRQAGEDKQKLT